MCHESPAEPIVYMIDFLFHNRWARQSKNARGTSICIVKDSLYGVFGSRDAPGLEGKFSCTCRASNLVFWGFRGLLQGFVIVWISLFSVCFNFFSFFFIRCCFVFSTPFKVKVSYIGL